MKKIIMAATCAGLFFGGTGNAIADSFDYSFLDAQDVSNALGLAVNPANNHVHISTLSYQGQDNLYEFDATGNLVNSTRVPYDFWRSGNLGSMTIGDNEHLYAHATCYNSNISPTERFILDLTLMAS